MEQIDPVKLQQVIVEHFSEDELRQLCFELGADFDDLPAKERDLNKLATTTGTVRRPARANGQVI